MIRCNNTTELYRTAWLETWNIITSLTPGIFEIPKSSLWKNRAIWPSCSLASINSKPPWCPMRMVARFRPEVKQWPIGFSSTTTESQRIAKIYCPNVDLLWFCMNFQQLFTLLKHDSYIKNGMNYMDWETVSAWLPKTSVLRWSLWLPVSGSPLVWHVAKPCLSLPGNGCARNSGICGKNYHHRAGKKWNNMENTEEVSAELYQFGCGCCLLFPTLTNYLDILTWVYWDRNETD